MEGLINLRLRLVLMKRLKRQLALVRRSKSCLVMTPSQVLRQDRIKAWEVVRVHANMVVGISALQRVRLPSRIRQEKWLLSVVPVEEGLALVRVVPRALLLIVDASLTRVEWGHW